MPWTWGTSSSTAWSTKLIPSPTLQKAGTQVTGSTVLGGLSVHAQDVLDISESGTLSVPTWTFSPTPS